MDIYTVYDRFSKRHDWLGVGSRKSKKDVEKILDYQCTTASQSKTAKMDKVLDIDACVRRIKKLKI